MKNRKRPRSQIKRSAPLPRIQEHAGSASKSPEHQDRPEPQADEPRHHLLKPPGDRPPGPPKIDLPIPEKPEPEDATQLARIDQISVVARTTWFGLLAYLAFVGVTLLGVEDADFFVPSRQTQLPLVNVAIPTSSFFWVAPILGAALYAYLHLQLLKLWEALAKPPPTVDGKPLSEHVYPWLISDFALSQRTDGAIPDRPLRLLSGWTTWLLVWWSAPLILGGFWWRSMPAHHEGMTLWIALCMMLTLYIGFTSRRKARIELRWLEGNTPWQGWFRRPMFAALCLFVIALSWVRTEGGIDHRFNQFVKIWNDANPGSQIYRVCPDDPSTENGKATYCFFRNGEAKKGAELQEAIVRNLPLIWTLDELTVAFDASWFGTAIHSVSSWQLFPSTELAGVDFVPNPDRLLDHTTERRSFRKTWCGRQGIGTETCGRLYTASEPAPDHLERIRLNWCKQPGRAIAPSDCAPFFNSLDDEFRQEWRQLWSSRTDALGKLNLSGADLRRADLNGVFLIGVDLTHARMEGADLRAARMEGAILRRTRMEGAILWKARMEGADLSWARMERADIREARMEGTNLFRARMEEAILREVRMEGADLSEARMEGADLSEARMEGANLKGAQLEAANLSEARMEAADLSEVGMEGANLRSARMEGANLNKARIDGANLSWARMGGADLSEARMEDVNLRKTRMEGANLKEALMAGAKLFKARMEGADLRGARMEGANLREAWMAGVNLREAWMEGANLRKARMAGADLLRARMKGANLRGAQMEGADLRGARMEGANLRGAQMEGADLRGARMARVNFRSADLKSVALNKTFADISVRAADLRSDHVTQQVLNNVFGDIATKILDGLVKPLHWDDETLENRRDGDPKFEAWLSERQAAKKQKATTNDN